MKFEQKNDTLVIEINIGKKTDRIKTILEYLKFEELTSRSNSSEAELDNLLKDAKKDRWKRTKDKFGLND